MNKIEVHKIESPAAIEHLNKKLNQRTDNIYNQIGNNMKLCNNCNTQLSCGCQRRTASDGNLCCDQCITSYEASIAPPPPKPIPVPEVKVKKTDIDGKS